MGFYQTFWSYLKHMIHLTKRSYSICQDSRVHLDRTFHFSNIFIIMKASTFSILVVLLYWFQWFGGCPLYCRWACWSSFSFEHESDWADLTAMFGFAPWRQWYETYHLHFCTPRNVKQQPKKNCTTFSSNSLKNKKNQVFCFFKIQFDVMDQLNFCCGYVSY